MVDRFVDVRDGGDEDVVDYVEGGLHPEGAEGVWVEEEEETG